MVLCARQVNRHHDVLHLLLDVGADIDKLNGEGMSALAVCHVLYYPFHCLHAAFTKPPADTQVSFYLKPFSCSLQHTKHFLSPKCTFYHRVLQSQSTHGSPNISQTAISSQSHLSDQYGMFKTKKLMVIF